MTTDLPALIPELDVADLDASLAIYRDAFGFRIAYARPEEAFAMLVRPGVSIMLQAADGPGRRFRTAPLEQPFGRGINLQIAVTDVDAVYAAVRAHRLTVPIPLEERRYRIGDIEAVQRQFVVSDPDGYLLRFCDLSPPSPTPSPDNSPCPRPNPA